MRSSVGTGWFTFAEDCRQLRHGRLDRLPKSTGDGRSHEDIAT
jgi:hypothetical protein